jgi:Ca2+-binding RTX toxin-like protein
LTRTLQEFPDYDGILGASLTTDGKAALAINHAFVELGNRYVDWLNDGNAPILDIAKSRETGDPGQSYHDNILVNLRDSPINNRFKEPKQPIDVDVDNDGSDDTGSSADPRSQDEDPDTLLAGDFGDRPEYSGYNTEDDLADLRKSIAWDIAHDVAPINQLDIDRSETASTADDDPLDGEIQLVTSGGVESFDSIQDAINKAGEDDDGAGDTIVLGPGSFGNETPAGDKITIDVPNLTIRGAFAGDAGSNRSGGVVDDSDERTGLDNVADAPTGESEINDHIRIEADNVTLDGLTFDVAAMFGLGDGHLKGGDSVIEYDSGTTIENSRFVETPGVGHNANSMVDLSTEADEVTNLTIRANAFVSHDDPLTSRGGNPVIGDGADLFGDITITENFFGEYAFLNLAPGEKSTAQISVTGNTFTRDGLKAELVGRGPLSQELFDKLSFDADSNTLPSSDGETPTAFWIHGTKGNDSLDGVYSSDFRDWLMPGLGDDTVTSGDGPDEVRMGEGDDVARGGAGNDELYGDEGDPWRGHVPAQATGEGNDQLFGDDGNDTLVGGLGNDTLTGGAGADVYEGSAEHHDGDQIDRIGDNDTIRVLDFTDAVVERDGTELTVAGQDPNSTDGGF